jgi:DNA-binding FadR family transcriptional regulator
MALDSLRRGPLVDQAAERLREQIAGGQWPVGTKLPGETTLATLLGVGRSTVREALRALAGAGMVRTRQGAGVFVIAARPVEDWPARLRRAAPVDVYEVRAMLEVQAARLAAVRRTPEDVSALRAALTSRSAAGAAAVMGTATATATATQGAVGPGTEGVAGAEPPTAGPATAERADAAGGAGTADAGGAGTADAGGAGGAGTGHTEPADTGPSGASPDGTYGGPGSAFIDADITLHAAVVAAAHNPVLTDLFAEFAPVLREKLLAPLDLIDVRAHDGEQGEAAHTALVEAIAAGEPDLAARVLAAELSPAQAHLSDRRHHAGPDGYTGHAVHDGRDGRDGRDDEVPS